ncbi:peptidoglycan-associated lipoprotein Pal [Deltaproteobacteria bacterium]|nr:peptidoglycan-associated lipoprotein Pal [Deltaproteobacteria bacterium]
MMNKTMTVLLILGFIFSSLFLAASCAQKQVVEEPVAVAPEEAERARMEAERQRAQETARMEAERQRAQEAARMEAEQMRAEQQKAEQLRQEIYAFESENICFDFDMSELKPEARTVLTKKAAFLKANPAYKVRIEGHCDERGTNEYNLALGERRANTASKFLNALDVAEYRITTLSYGEERPADSGHNEDAWSKNRRDEFKLIQ